MKNHIIIALALLMSLGVENVGAQSFLNKLGKAIEKEVKKEVRKEVEKKIDQLTGGKSGQAQSQPQPQPQQVQSQQKQTKNVVPTVVESQPDVRPVTGSINGYEWVDLGLPSGTLWATCNVDASKPSQPGTLYAWGETSTKSSYTQDNCKYYKKEQKDFSGDKSADVAAAKWGDGWRMPSRADFDELLHYCNWAYVQKDGRWGSEITSPFNSRSIFLPVTGYKEETKHMEAGGNGMYWTSTPHEDQWNNGAHMYQFGGALGELSIGDRSYGYAVRPVADNDAMISTPSQGETNGHAWVDLGLPSGRKWATCNLGGSSSENHGEFFAWAQVTPILDEESPKNDVRGKWMSGIGGSTTYDAATAMWGEGWKMPTKADFQELLENCDWEWTTLGRITGCKAVSRINGNYIFLPASGVIHPNSLYPYPDSLNDMAWYWASTPSGDEYYINADAFLVAKSATGTAVHDRRDGLAIRPVTE